MVRVEPTVAECRRVGAVVAYYEIREAVIVEVADDPERNLDVICPLERDEGPGRRNLTPGRSAKDPTQPPEENAWRQRAGWRVPIAGHVARVDDRGAGSVAADFDVRAGDARR